MEHVLPTEIPVETCWLESREEVLTLDAVAELIEEVGGQGDLDENISLHPDED